MKRQDIKRRRLSILLSVFLLLLPVYLAASPFSLTDAGGAWLDGDIGLLTNNGLRILHGDLLYRDVWTIYGPAQDYLIAGVLGVFGSSLFTLRIVLAIAGATTAILFFYLSMQLTSRLYTIISLAILILLGPVCDNYPYPSWFCIPIGLCMILMQHLSWKRRQIKSPENLLPLEDYRPGNHKNLPPTRGMLLPTGGNSDKPAPSTISVPIGGLTQISIGRIGNLLSGFMAGILFSFKVNWGVYGLIALFMIQSVESLIVEDAHGRPAGTKYSIGLFYLVCGSLPVLSLLLIAGHFSMSNLIVFTLPALCVSFASFMLLSLYLRKAKHAPAIFNSIIRTSIGFGIAVAPWAIYFLLRLGPNDFYQHLIQPALIMAKNYYFPLSGFSLGSTGFIVISVAQGLLILRGNVPRILRASFAALWMVFFMFFCWEFRLLVSDFFKSSFGYNPAAVQSINYLPLAVHVGFFFVILRDMRNIENIDRHKFHLEFSLWIYSVCMFHMFFPLMEIYHLIWVMPPVILLGSLFIYRSVAYWKTGRKLNGGTFLNGVGRLSVLIIPVYLLYLFCMPLVKSFLLVESGPLRIHIIEQSVLDIPNGKVVMKRVRADSIEEVVHVVESQTQPKDYIFDMTGTFFNFLTERRNPTRWGVYYRGFLSAEDIAQIERDLERTKPKIVVNSSWGERNFYYNYPDLYTYIYRKYSVAETFLEYQIMQRRDDALQP